MGRMTLAKLRRVAELLNAELPLFKFVALPRDEVNFIDPPCAAIFGACLGHQFTFDVDGELEISQDSWWKSWNLEAHLPPRLLVDTIRGILLQLSRTTLRDSLLDQGFSPGRGSGTDGV